jgi:hypothetical protein
VAEALPAGAVVRVHEVEPGGVGAEGLLAAWAEPPGVERGQLLAAELVVLSAIAALLPSTSGPVVGALAVPTPGLASYHAAAVEAGAQ